MGRRCENYCRENSNQEKTGNIVMRKNKGTIRQYLKENPGAIKYGDDIKRAIGEKRISLKGSPAEIVKRAYAYSRRGIEGSIEAWFEEEDQRAREKFEREHKEGLKRNAKE
jgi:hypothetical protein